MALNFKTSAAKSNLSRLVDPLLDAAGGNIALLKSTIETKKLSSLVQNLSDVSNNFNAKTDISDTDK